MFASGLDAGLLCVLRVELVCVCLVTHEKAGETFAAAHDSLRIINGFIHFKYNHERLIVM